jgi:hypothetical protein
MIHGFCAAARFLFLIHTHSKLPASAQENIFEWHFTVRGPADTPFAGGIYHGRIILPAEYPFKPPSIIFLTVCGRVVALPSAQLVANEARRRHLPPHIPLHSQTVDSSSTRRSA